MMAKAVAVLRCEDPIGDVCEDPIDDDPFLDVRDPHTNKLLFRYDPDRQLVEVVRRGIKVLIDLSIY